MVTKAGEAKSRAGRWTIGGRVPPGWWISARGVVNVLVTTVVVEPASAKGRPAPVRVWSKLPAKQPSLHQSKVNLSAVMKITTPGKGAHRPL